MGAADIRSDSWMNKYRRLTENQDSFNCERTGSKTIGIKYQKRLTHSIKGYNLLMAIIKDLRLKIKRDELEFSKHAVDQTILRGISVQEIRDAVRKSEIIEDYPDDKYGPSYLLFGFTKMNRPLHIHCSHPSRNLVKVITVYEPDPDLWIDFKYRR